MIKGMTAKEMRLPIQNWLTNCEPLCTWSWQFIQFNNIWFIDKSILILDQKLWVDVMETFYMLYADSFLLIFRSLSNFSLNQYFSNHSGKNDMNFFAGERKYTVSIDKHFWSFIRYFLIYFALWLVHFNSYSIKFVKICYELLYNNNNEVHITHVYCSSIYYI